MTIEEKASKLEEICYTYPGCTECPLYNEECLFDMEDEERINHLYAVAFPNTDTTQHVKDEHLATVAEIIAKECDKAVENYKAALLKKIFPYDAVDKKQYSINAYAVWQAINETEVHHD